MKSLLHSDRAKMIRHTQWVLCAALLLFSLFTLGISPLPWYDEIDFASISVAYGHSGKFICTANDLYFTGGTMEVLYYGPVYFVLSSWMVKLFGIGMVQFRILNFVAGVVCIGLFPKLFERLNGRKYTVFALSIFILLMLSDYTYLQDMHSGRMDLIGAAFVLTGLWFANADAKKMELSFLLSGLLIAVGLLTTPRVYFLVLPYYTYLLVLCVRTKQRRLAGAIGIAVIATCLLYFIWIWVKFGSVGAFSNYLHSKTSYFDTAQSAFFVNSFDMPLYQAWYYFALLGLLIVAAIKDYRILLTPINLVCMATIILFLFLAGGSVVNMCLVTGFIYILMMNLAAEMPGTGGYGLMWAVLLANFALFGYKYSVVLSNMDNRSAKSIGNWIKEVVPEGSKVVADDKYYYSVVKNQSAFQYMYRGGTDEQRVDYHTNKWKAGYLLTSDTLSPIFHKYQNAAKLIFAGEYKPSETHRQVLYAGSYQGYLFRFERQ